MSARRRRQRSRRGSGHTARSWWPSRCLALPYVHTIGPSPSAHAPDAPVSHTGPRAARIKAASGQAPLAGLAHQGRRSPWSARHDSRREVWPTGSFSSSSSSASGSEMVLNLDARFTTASTASREPDRRALKSSLASSPATRKEESRDSGAGCGDSSAHTHCKVQ